MPFTLPTLKCVHTCYFMFVSLVHTCSQTQKALLAVGPGESGHYILGQTYCLAG